MIRSIWTLAGSILVQAVAAAGVTAQQTRLDSLILAAMDRYHLPGLAAAAVDSGRVVWIGTYGFANADSQIRVTAETPFHIASVSKPFTATVLLSLYVAAPFDLDRDINSFLSFPVRNPNHSNIPVTVRQLLRHRSSIADNGEYYEPFWSEADGDPTTPLGDYLRDYLSPGGASYDSARNFLSTMPGTSRRYCNTCYALLGYLAEVIANTPFERLSEEVLFDPLGMTRTAWFLRGLDGPAPAMPYRFAQDTGFIAYGHNGYPDWPAGQLRSSIHDLGRFLGVYASGGKLDGRTVIDPRVVDLMAPADAELGFHTWSQLALRNRQILYVHQGGDIGVSSVMGFRRQGARGVVVVANSVGPLLPIFEDVFLAIDTLVAGLSPRPERNQRRMNRQRRDQQSDSGHEGNRSRSVGVGTQGSRW